MVEKKSEVIFEGLKKLQWNKMFHMYYIEPVVMALVFSHALSGTIMKNQLIFQACTTIFNYNVSDCEQLGTSNASDYANKIETEVQPYIANLFMIRTILESIVPAICGIFIGSWSDYYGRKPLILISMIGFSFTYVITAAICELSFYYPINPWYYIIAAIPHSILGGNCVFMVGALCFLTDITDITTRPYRMLFMEAWVFISLMSGSLLSSFVYSATNSTTVFSISGILMCLATAFVAFYIPETLHWKKDEPTIEENANKIDTEKNMNLNIIDCQMCVPETISDKKDGDSKTPQKEPISKSEEETKKLGLFSFEHIKGMFYTCIKPRESYDRSIIWLVTGAMFILVFILDGAMTVFYLFVREKFHWNVREFTYYESVSHMGTMLGTLVGFLILRKICNLSVVTLALIAFCSDVISSVVRGFASESWHLYLAVALGSFRSIAGPMCRTIVSNIVPQTDLGKIFSIKNILTSFAPFLAAPVYTFIYQQSITTFPGLFFIVSAVLYLLALIFISLVLHFKLKDKERYSEILN